MEIVRLSFVNMEIVRLTTLTHFTDDTGIITMIYAPNSQCTYQKLGLAAAGQSAGITDDRPHVGVLPLNVLPDIGKRVAVEITHAALVISLTRVPVTARLTSGR